MLGCGEVRGEVWGNVLRCEGRCGERCVGGCGVVGNSVEDGGVYGISVLGYRERC